MNEWWRDNLEDIKKIQHLIEPKRGMRIQYRDGKFGILTSKEYPQDFYDIKMDDGDMWCTNRAYFILIPSLDWMVSIDNDNYWFWELGVRWGSGQRMYKAIYSDKKGDHLGSAPFPEAACLRALIKLENKDE